MFDEVFKLGHPDFWLGNLSIKIRKSLHMVFICYVKCQKINQFVLFIASVYDLIGMFLQ